LKRRDEQLLGWLSFGAFLVIVGAMFLITPNLTDEIEAFFRDFEIEQVSGHFYFPTPQNPHPTIYESAAIFCFAYFIYQFLLLILKFALEAEPTKKSETFTSLIFWPATGYVLLMLKDGTIEWLTFLATLVILAAIVIIIRSAAHIIFKKYSPS
jgi:Ca2+/Na+ antiporter